MELLKEVKDNFPSDNYVFVSSVGNHLYAGHIYEKTDPVVYASIGGVWKQPAIDRIKRHTEKGELGRK